MDAKAIFLLLTVLTTINTPSVWRPRKLLMTPINAKISLSIFRAQLVRIRRPMFTNTVSNTAVLLVMYTIYNMVQWHALSYGSKMKT